MSALNWPCPTCEKSHRDEEAIAKCKVRAERRAEREAAKKVDVERRLKNRKDLPETAFIRQSVTEAKQWERIVSGLNKDYPIREQGKWTLYEVVEEDSKNLLGTWPTDLETITLLRLERLVTGDYLSRNPLSLPLDGSYSLVGKVA
jgi:reverse gyrase